MRNSHYQPLPLELNSPTTAWPYLRRRFPWLFNEDGEVLKEQPAAHLGTVDQDIITFAKHFLKDKDFKLADIAQALTGSRLYAGSNLVKRLQAVQSAIKDTTTTPEVSLQDDFGEVVAA